MNKTQKTIFLILGIALTLFLLWFFRYLVFCGITAMILSYIGSPLMKLLQKFQYKKFKMGTGLSASITLLSLLLGIFLVFRLFIPLIVSQASSFSQIDINGLLTHYKEPMDAIAQTLYQYGIIDTNTTFENLINSQLTQLFQILDYKLIANTLLSVITELFLGIFIVLFITFFLLKDSHLFFRLVLTLTPDKYEEEIKHILQNSQYLISRYFIGLCCEILLITTLLSIGFSLFGFSNAILIAACCGILVIIPYVGTIIGGGIGFLICLASILSIDPSAALLPIVLKFWGTFLVVKFTDDFVMQPLIYSKSVKAHPLEIFLVILMASEIGGIVGMIMAIPVYTFLRITAKEFFSGWKVVKSLTKNM